MLDRRSITSGMAVRGPHGERLGWVAACGEHQLQVDKGRLRRRHFLAPYRAVAGIEHGDVVLEVGREGLKPGNLHGRGEVLTYVQPVASLKQLHGWDPAKTPSDPPYHASGPHEGPGAEPH
ncbi:MAG: hypothetical protein L0Y66_09670 [Myxococcaceae bacterium]|nr:hypothetical protein [Myxococcaceae bacterium]MCI0673901.1 hypothetical protein [Myxococcaceae bacterium]